MSSPFFDVFTHRSQIRGVIECVSALRVGVGRANAALNADLPILRDARGIPVIPGASIKGVVRSQVEALLRSVRTDWAADPFDQSTKEQGNGEEKGTARERALRQREEIKKSSDEAGRIFGRPSLASHVCFFDAYPLAGTAVEVEVRDGVAIDRDLGRVSGAKKYDFQVVAAGSRFELRLMMDGLEPRQEGAVLAGLDLLHEGFIRLGGFKSRGLGLVRLADLQVNVLQGPTLEKSTPEWKAYHDERVVAFRAWLDHAERGAA